jgi:hypothetical protein
MTVQALSRYRLPHKSRALLPALAALAVVGIAAVIFVAYVLWPSWPRSSVALDAPALPVTVVGVLFNVPPAAVRAAVQRQPGAHERMDLVFLWPSLQPPGADHEAAPAPPPADGAASLRTDDRLFVTIAGLGTVLPPLTRLRSIYPRYIETQAVAGPDGLAIVPFRAGTPYEGEDLIYLSETPEQFFVRCSRPVRATPGTCIHERAVDAAEVTFRFPRSWLDDWRNVAAGLDRLMTQLHAGGS